MEASSAGVNGTYDRPPAGFCVASHCRMRGRLRLSSALYIVYSLEFAQDLPRVFEGSLTTIRVENVGGLGTGSDTLATS